MHRLFNRTVPTVLASLGAGDGGQYLCGENTSPVTHWVCAAERRAQPALLVSTRETVPFSSPAEKTGRVTVGAGRGPGAAGPGSE